MEFSGVGGGGWKKVSAAVAAADSSIDFTGMVVGYDYRLFAERVLPVTDAVYFVTRLGIIGPTYRTSGYIGSGTQISSAGGSAGSADAGKISLASGNQTFSNALTEGTRFIVDLFNPAAAAPTNYLTRGEGHSDGSSFISFMGGGFYNAVESHTAIRFSYSVGNISVGNFTLYRRKA